MRARAIREFGKATLPARGDFKTLYDALQLQHCNVSAPRPTQLDAWTPPTFATPAAGALFVAPDAPSGGDGSKAKPFGTLAAAVAAAAGRPRATILLRAGTHHSGQLELGAQHSGLVIQNFEGEHAVVSGGVPLAASKAAWKPYNVSVAQPWPVQPPNPRPALCGAHSFKTPQVNCGPCCRCK